MKKNDLLTLKIEGMGNEGEGIGKADGFPLFIKDALPGDVIRAKALKVKKTYGYGRLMEIVTAFGALFLLSGVDSSIWCGILGLALLVLFRLEAGRWEGDG